MKSFVLISILLLVTPSRPMSIQEAMEKSTSLEGLLKELSLFGPEILQNLAGIEITNNKNFKDLVEITMQSFNEKLQDHSLLTNLIDSLGLQQDFVKPLEKMIQLANELDLKTSVLSIGSKYDENGKNDIFSSPKDIMQLSQSLLDIFVPESNGLESSIVNSNLHSNSKVETEEVTYDSISTSVSNIWLVIKSIWQKILAHVKEEHSLTFFMKLTPVKIIDHFLSLGDDVNLVNFLAKKLDPSLADFIAHKINPYFGPFKSFDTFYSFLKGKKLNGILDYFGSKRFRYTFDTMTKVASAYLEDTVTDDIVNSYIDFISFNNTELHNFYQSVLRNLHQNSETVESNSIDGKERLKRDIFQDIASLYKHNENSEDSYDHHVENNSESDRESSDVISQFYSLTPDASEQETDDLNYSQRIGNYENPNLWLVNDNYTETEDYTVYTKSYATASPYLQEDSSVQSNKSVDDDSIDPASRQLPRIGVSSAGSVLYDVSRDGYGYGGGGYGGGYGGYGGGGYGGMTMDPYMILGSLILGTLLGFLLFRALRATRRGRRDINDGSLSLWDSDVPKDLFWGSSSAERMKRSALMANSSDSEEFNLPASLRGDVWSTDPLIGEEFFEDVLQENDVADHLNRLWQIYRESNETSCIQSHLCGYMSNSTAEHLTSKDSSITLLMASLGNMMGLSGSGQLVDDVTHNLVVGNPYSCPIASGCHFSV